MTTPIWSPTASLGNSGDAERTLIAPEDMGAGHVIGSAPSAGATLNGHATADFVAASKNWLMDWNRDRDFSDPEGEVATSWLDYHYDRRHIYGADDNVHGKYPRLEHYQFESQGSDVANTPADTASFKPPDAFCLGLKLDFTVIVLFKARTAVTADPDDPIFDPGLVVTDQSDFAVAFSDAGVRVSFRNPDDPPHILTAACPVAEWVLAEFRTDCPPDGHAYADLGTIELRASTQDTTGDWVTDTTIFPPLDPYAAALIIGANFLAGQDRVAAAYFDGLIATVATDDSRKTNAQLNAFRRRINSRFGLNFATNV